MRFFLIKIKKRMYQYKAVKIEGKKYDVHRLVMEEHLGRSLGINDIIHHIDGDKRNNDISNLKLMTRSEHSSMHVKEIMNNNGEAQKRTTKARITYSNRYTRGKLNRDQVLNIIELCKSKSITKKEIAKMFNIDRSTVYKIRIGEIWSNINDCNSE